MVVIGGLVVLVLAAFALAAMARALGARTDAQRAADLAALAGARAMHAAYPRLFEAASAEGRASPAHLSKAAYLELGRDAAAATASANGFAPTAITFPDGDTFAPVRIRVAVAGAVRVGEERAELAAFAEAELAPDGGEGLAAMASGGGYDGPLEYRQGKPMRPDVAAAFDRMAAAARDDGVHLVINSGFRSDAEQAVLFARHPDPKWVAPPGRSLHRYGTELDIGPPAAYGWLAANAPRFRFILRYGWEPWHWGFSLNPRSAPRAAPAREDGKAAAGHGAVPAFVPARFAPLLADAAQRYNVSATMLAAQLHAESNFNPFAVSRAGAQGIAQFMPQTAAAYGLRNAFDPAQAIDAQARLMRDLLRRFASVPLALAAYNAGPAPVAACGCVPPIPETRGYVARILGLMGGAGEEVGSGVMTVRLVG